MRGSFRIGRILRIPVEVNPTWFLLLALVVSVLATQVFAEQFNGQPWWVQWLFALGTAVIFFFSMVLHELGHSVIARLYGIPVRSITLFALGAVAQTTRETRRPHQEFLMAVAGPVVSLLLAGAFMLVWFAAGSADSLLANVAAWLWLTNFAVGVFNLIPAYPMDGGRVLRAALWGITGSARRATRWASLVGRGFAYALMALGFLVAIQVPGILEGRINPFSGAQFILVGLFINFAARQSDIQSVMLDKLSRHRVGDIMLRDLPVVMSTSTVRDALLGPLIGYGPSREWVLVSDGTGLVGLVTRAALGSVPEEQWGAARVGDLMLPRERLQSVATSEGLDEAVQRMDADELPLLIVVEAGEVAGIVHRGQIAALVASRPVMAANRRI